MSLYETSRATTGFAAAPGIWSLPSPSPSVEAVVASSAMNTFSLTIHVGKLMRLERLMSRVPLIGGIGTSGIRCAIFALGA